LARSRRVSELRVRNLSGYSINEKYGTNGGSIEGIWIFHRHGDRTPSSPLCSDHLIEEEAAFWRSKLPNDSSVEEVAKRFPKKIHSDSIEGYLDGKQEPYGFLTRVGTSQMYNTGRRFSLRYHRLGRKDRSLAGGNSGATGLLQNWDVTAFSTNYLRTITSAQFFLDGLLNAEVQLNNKLKDAETLLDKDINAKYDDNEAVIPVNVRSREVDTLNAFDKNPKKMLNLVKEVVSSPTFQERDSLAVPLATLLANYLPGLTSGKRQLFGGPSGINWIHATDHFVCRASHGLKLTSFAPNSNHDKENEIPKTIRNANSFVDTTHEDAMQALAHPTIAHLAWRFSQWFTHGPLLGAITIPPLKEVEKQMREVPNLSMDEKRPLKIFSCHDVTLLSILYGLGATEIIENERYWPPYGSTLAFELVKVKETDEYVIRFLLNGKPIKLREFDDKLISIDEFSELVDNLQREGRIDDDDEDTDGERDMENWTG